MQHQRITVIPYLCNSYVLLSCQRRSFCEKNNVYNTVCQSDFCVLRQFQLFQQNRQKRAAVKGVYHAISASRPGARRETLETYIKRLEKLEEIADSFDGVEKSFAVQAGREIRLIVKPEKVSDSQMVIMAREVAEKELLCLRLV